MLARLRKLAKYSFAVPWSVPQWAWREFGATLAGSVPLRRDSPARFAARAGARLGLQYAVPVARGRVAIELGLRAMGVRPGDDVVLPSYTCDAVPQAVGHLGARPVFADIGPALNVTPETILAALTPATRCVIVPHLFGAPAAIPQIEAALAGRGIPAMDDAAQALGATVAGRPVGSFGACGILCCGPAKPLAGSGGGLLLTNDRALFERASALAPAAPWKGARRRVVRVWIWGRFRRITLPAWKVLTHLGPSLAAAEADYRSEGMTELEARIALVQLARLADTIAERRKHAAVMLSGLGPFARYNVVDVGPGTAATQLALVLPEAGPSVREMIAALAAGGVESQGGYRPCHLRFAGGIAGGLAYTERVWRRVLVVPLETPLRDPARLAAALQRLS
ncbi:MAG TPA: DegT/DnrJ/EryC1/StrS family aminotransferase [Gemmatimonadales bacterium]|nr:DegT/DnrJ/EryC1/StrS family aminotransferase [Gemmatimonadales bacterium]